MLVSEVFDKGTAPGWLVRGEGDSVEVVGWDGTLAQVFVTLLSPLLSVEITRAADVR
jgi:hypothetical protein